MKYKSLLAVVLAAIAGGSVVVFAKFVLADLEPFTVVSLRFFFATLSLLPFVVLKRGLSLKDFRQNFGIALLGALNPIVLFIGLQFTKASVSPLLYAVIPSITVLYLYFVKKVRLKNMQIFGVLLGLAGVAIIVLLPLFQNQNTLSLYELKGNLIILLAVVAFFLYGLKSKQAQSMKQVSPIVLTFYFALVTFLISLPLSLWEMNQAGALALSRWDVKIWLSAFEMGVIGTGLFYVSFQYALKYGSALSASFFTYLQPVATIVLAFLVLGEKLTWPFALGGALSILGAEVATRATRQTTDLSATRV